MKRYIYMHRRGTIEEWESANNPIPCEGEIVIELDEINKFHKLKIGDGVTPYSELAYLKAGDEIVTQVLAQARPRVVSITLDVDKWTEITCESDPNFGYYGQTVELSDITAQSRLDLQLDADMVVEFQKLDLIFVTENKGGVITVYSIGAMPLQSYTMQATIVEVEVPSDCDKVVGIPIAAKHTHSNADVLNNLSDTDGILLYNGEQISAASGSGIYIGSGDMPEGYNVQIDPNGEATETLPNPYALTFTGAATDSYDGSEPVEVNIPTGTGGGSSKITDVRTNADGSLTLVVETVIGVTDGLVETEVTQYRTASLKGEKGDNGAVIENIVFNDDYTMVITTEEVKNGNVVVHPGIVYTSPSLKGADGIDGTSVTVSSVSESTEDGGENVVTFSDGKTLTVLNGKQGEKGADGAQGEQGEPGKDGVSVTHSWNGTTLTVTSASGTSSADLKGEQGEQGIQGIPGEKGDTGEQGIQGEQGESGVYVGSGTPPTGTKVQVNPDGESIEILTAEETRSIITEMLADKAQLQPEYADSLEELEASGDTSKLYVLPDGYIYAYATTTTTIVPTNQIPNSVNSDGTSYVGDNGEKGYRLQHRINSSEEEVPATAYACTGFMPFKADDFIRSKNLSFDNLSNSQVRLYDSNFVRLVIITGSSTDYPLSSLQNDNGDLDGRLSDAITSVDDATKAKVAYIRVVALTFDDTAILTRNEPTETQTITQEAWYNTGHAFVPANYEDRIIDVENKAESNSNRLGVVEETLKGFSPDTEIPVLVKEGASALVDKALSREDNRVIRFLINSDAHQKNDDTLITKGTKELAQAHKAVLSQMGVDFVANLGDMTWGSSGSDNATVLEEGKAFNELFLDSMRGQVNLWTEGNHETGMLTASQIYGLIYAHNKGLVQDTEHLIEGYGYMDFPNQKVRVICLNTNQGTASGNVSGISNEQLEWFAEKALDMSNKTDWSVFTLGHHPLSYNTVSLFRYAVETIKAFINGDDFSLTTNDGFTFGFNYGGKNCQYVGHFHGHAHAFSVVKMQRYVASGSYEEIDAWEICIPNACYTRNNQYKGNGTYVERYSTETTYDKADVDGQRTSFSLVTVCLDEKKIYADNYGAGIDRVISY